MSVVGAIFLVLTDIIKEEHYWNADVNGIGVFGDISYDKNKEVGELIVVLGFISKKGD